MLNDKLSISSFLDNLWIWVVLAEGRCNKKAILDCKFGIKIDGIVFHGTHDVHIVFGPERLNFEQCEN